MWLWVALSIAAVAARGQALGLDRHLSNRLKLHAIPVAISVLYHGRVHDYAAFKSVAMSMRGGDIGAAIAQPVPPDDPTYYWVADDRGLADYVIAAFALFGPHVTSLYWMFFVVFAASMALFLLDLGRHAVAAALAVLVTTALYASLPVIPLGNLTLPIFEVGALFEPRVFELLSYVAALHLGMTVWLDQRWTPGRRAIVSAQTVVLVACYHARSSIGWQLLFVFLSVAARLAVASWHAEWTRGWRRLVFGSSWPAVSLVAGLAMLTVYQRATFNPRYFTDMGSRTVWHNALMGLSWSDTIARKYQLNVDDALVVEAVRKHYFASGVEGVSPRWTEIDVLGTLGGLGETNWFDYEKVARALYLHIWRTEPVAMIRNYAVAKPLEIARVVFRATHPQAGAVSGLGPAAPVDGLGFHLFSPMVVLLALPALVLAYVAPEGWPLACALVAAMLVCSLIPGLMFYPVVHTMMGAFATLAILGYSVLAAGVAAVRRRLMSASA